MKIIHCSDLHLDSRMEANLSFEKAKERNHEILLTFERLVKYAKQNDVDLVMFAGDLFDTERISASTVDYFLNEIRNAKEIDFLYLKGNHDESKHAFIGEELPDNLKLFNDQWISYNYDFLTITGIEINKDNASALYQELSLNKEETNIVMLHGQEATQPGVDMVCLPQLKNKNIDYLALGHIHSYKKERLDDRGSYAYCGCLEGRGFDECGEKGFILLDVKPHNIQTTFVPFAKRQLHDVEVDITGKETITEIKRAMEVASSSIDHNDLVKFTLVGEYTFDTQKDFEFLKKAFADDFYFSKIKDSSHLKIEKENYENDISLKGEFIRKVMASDLSNHEKEEIICAGIQALSGKEIIR